MASEPRVCVTVLPIVSQRFPFLHGNETGRRPQLPLSFPMKATSERGQESPTLAPAAQAASGRLRDREVDLAGRCVKRLPVLEHCGALRTAKPRSR
jgi:hypothetical protein